MNSSLVYEILLYLNSYYFWMFAICEVGVTLFKVVNLPYPVASMVVEIIMFIFLCTVEAVRLFMGHKGNLTEQSTPVLVSLFLTVPSTIGIIYFLLWQTYVLRLEVVLCGIQLALLSGEIVFSTVCIVTFYRNRVY